MITRTGVRYFAAPPPAAKPLPELLAKTRVSAWQPKKSDPIEGFGLIGILSGTMFVTMIPGFWYALTPAPAHDEH